MDSNLSFEKSVDVSDDGIDFIIYFFFFFVHKYL